MDMIELRWPKSNQTLVICSVMANVLPRQQQPSSSHIAILVEDNDPQLIEFSEEIQQGMLTRMCIWPTSISPDASLVVLLSYTAGWNDALITGFEVNPAGDIHPVNLGNALTLFGWFNLQDLDDDGSYELITLRSLDGNVAGFTYNAVRKYDAASRTYLPEPDVYREFFESELDRLEWIIQTRHLIQAHPEKYLSNEIEGYAYVAEYQGQQYGFDSIIELPETYTGLRDVAAYNSDRREAFNLVKKYRDELKAWLEGGTYPATWKLPQ